jgi:hypothetical protein
VLGHVIFLINFVPCAVEKWEVLSQEVTLTSAYPVVLQEIRSVLGGYLTLFR